MMATPPQPPPPDSWQQAPPPSDSWQQPPPQAGYTGPVLTASRISPMRLWGWIISAAVLVLAAGGFFVVHSASSQAKGYLVLPVNLLGLQQNTSVPGELLLDRLKKAEIRGNPGELTGVVAAVYGVPFGAFTVSGGGLCGACSPVSESQLKSGMVARGYTNVRMFPPGPKGGELACGTRSSQGSPVIRCAWVDDRTAGDILYFSGSATGLTDAAAQSITVRSAVEH